MANDSKSLQRPFDLVKYLGGIANSCVEQGLSFEKTAEILHKVGKPFCTDLEKLANSFLKPMSIEQAMNPKTWQAPQAQQQPQQQQAQPQTPTNTVNQNGIAPLPSRYRFDLDDTVTRIKREQLEWAQKKNREAQKATHVAGQPAPSAGTPNATIQ